MGHGGPCSEVNTLIIKTEKKGKYKSIWHIIISKTVVVDQMDF